MNWSKLVQKNLISNSIENVEVLDIKQNNNDSNLLENNISKSDIYDNLIRPYIFDSFYDIYNNNKELFNNVYVNDVLELFEDNIDYDNIEFFNEDDDNDSDENII